MARPKADKAGKRVTVYLSGPTLELMESHGRSAGEVIRKLIQAYAERAMVGELEEPSSIRAQVVVGGVCKRCQRVGLVKDCDDCKALRR